MKKVFVLYSLKQKLTPLIYKTKSIVNKHINTNRALLYEQFESEEQAKTFIEKFSIQCITKSLNNKNINNKQPMSQAQVKKLVQSIVGKEKLQSKGKSTRKPSVSTNDKMLSQQQQVSDLASRQVQWTILPNGHAFRKSNTTQEQIIDSSYSTLNKHQPQSATPQAITHENNHQSYISRQQMLSSLMDESQTTQGLTEQDSFNSSNIKDKSGKLSYWMVWNTNSSQLIKMGKRKTQLGLLMYDLETKHSKDWVKMNIQLKRFKTKKQAQLQLDQLNKQKETKLNKMKADKIRENIITNSYNNLSLEEQQQQQVKNLKQQEQYMILNYDDIEDLTQRVMISNNNNKNDKVDGNKKRNRVKIEGERILWADDLIKQSIEVQQQQESVVMNNVDNRGSGVMMGTIGMGQMGPYVEQQYQVIANVNAQPILSTKAKQETAIGESSQILATNQQQQQQELQKQSVKQQQIQQLNQSKEQLQTIVNFYQQIQQMQQLNIKVEQCIEPEQPIISQKQQQQQQQLQLAKQNEQQQVGRMKEQLSTQDHKQQQQQQQEQHVEQSIHQQLQQQQQQYQQQPTLHTQNIQQSPQQQAIVATSITATPIQQSLTNQRSQPVKTIIYQHPYNKRYIKQVILNKLNRQQQQQHSQINQQQQQQYIIYPSLVIKQSPGFAIGSYQIKQSKTNKLIKKQSIALGQCKHQQANLLSLAFTLSSTYNLHNNSNKRRMKLQLNQQMQESLSYKYKFDKQLIETQEFIREIENKCNGRLQYIL